MLQTLKDLSRAAYGLEIVRASAGAIGRNGIYVVLARLASKGFVNILTERVTGHPGLPRPQYRLTERGMRVLKVVGGLK